MKKHLLFLMLLGCGSIATVQAQSLRNNNAQIEMAAIQVDVGPSGSGYYNDGFYDNCQVWAGPGWYYGFWFNAEPTYYNWCGTRYYRYGYYPYYRRGYGYGWFGRGHGGRGWGGGHRGGHGGGHRGGGGRHH